jgi:hypothetical protein
MTIGYKRKFKVTSVLTVGCFAENKFSPGCGNIGINL